MNGEESKQFLIDYLHITENCYKDLCNNSPSTYTIKDGSFYVSSGDGGQAGWSYSQIVDYTINENVITYNCERVGSAEEWGYDEDLIQPFTFSLAYENNEWKLNSVSYTEGFLGLIYYHDWELTLHTEKTELTEGEPLHAYAELKYIGDKDEVTVYGSSECVHFTLKGDRYFTGNQGDALISGNDVEHTIKSGEIIRTDYIPSAYWNANDPKAELYEQYRNTGDGILPAGKYTLTAFTGFTCDAISISKISSVDITVHPAENREPANDNEIKAIENLLYDFKSFSYGYLECKEVKNHIDTHNSISENSVKYYLVPDGEIITPEDMHIRMSEVLTDDMINDEANVYHTYYLERDGKLYLSENAGNDGGVLGTDKVYINSVSKKGDTYYVNMTAWGDKDNWDLNEDFENNFEIRIKKTADGFRIDECGAAEMAYIAWIYTADN